MTYTHTQTEKKYSKSPCAPPPPEPVSCCEMVCFERPNYFCGHLLTDADLMREQWYFREKNKLYHRTLHGNGIVCGLRLTSDYQCSGHVLIGEGYAIDDCGNDLLVCEPQSFDVVSLLRAKGLLLEGDYLEPCEPEDTNEPCDVPQCFYVTICYDEKPGDFTTPFMPGCRPTLSECEPTRIRETVSFDVVDELPKQAGPLDDLRERLEACFKIFSDGAFAKALKNNSALLKQIIQKTGNIEQHATYFNLFRELRGLLLLYLRNHPDKYNCGLDDQIRAIYFPDPEKDGNSYMQKLHEAFCRLLELAWQYAVSCALGELVPACPKPSHGSCIVLGTVEVLKGKVTHVCNCPRTYVWSFVNFFEVLLATQISGEACKHEDKKEVKVIKRTEAVENLEASDAATPSDEARSSNTSTSGTPRNHVERHTCCREFEIDCDFFLKLLEADPRSPAFAATASLDAAAQMIGTFKQSINFTQARTFSPRLFENLKDEDAKAIAANLGLKVEVGPQRAFNPIDFLMMAGLATTDTPLVLSQEQGTIKSAHADTSRAAAVPDDLKQQVERAEKTAKDLEARLAKREAEIEQLKVSLETAGKAISEMQTRLPAPPPPSAINEAIEAAPAAEETPKTGGRRRGKKEDQQ